MVRGSAQRLSSLNSQLFAGVWAEALRRPRRIPNHVHIDVTYSYELLDAGFYLLANGYMRWAALSCQSHIHSHILLLVFGRVEPNAIDQSQINNVDRNFRIVAVFQRGEHFVLSGGWHDFLYFKFTGAQ